jgi:hypothetical protein
LSKSCKWRRVERNIRQVLYVSWHPLPVVAAARNVESLLRKGGTEITTTEHRGVVITASGPEELRSEITQLDQLCLGAPSLSPHGLPIPQSSSLNINGEGYFNSMGE